MALGLASLCLMSVVTEPGSDAGCNELFEVLRGSGCRQRWVSIAIVR